MTGRKVQSVPEWLDVSRETLDRLDLFVALVKKWNVAINLVSKRSLSDIWERHILDSAQLYALIPQTARSLVDFGSGGGFPGIVLAIMARVTNPDLNVVLVEVDQRKAAFLSEALRQLELRGVVHAQRIEGLPPQNADVVTARALAPLATLFGYAARHLHSNGIALFSKGAQFEAEISDCRQSWHFTLARVESLAEEKAAILVVKELRHV